MHGLIFETSVCYWQNQPGCYLTRSFLHRTPHSNGVSWQKRAGEMHFLLGRLCFFTQWQRVLSSKSWRSLPHSTSNSCFFPGEEDGIRCFRFTVTSECVMGTDCLATRYWAYRVGQKNGAFLSNFDRNLTHSEYSEGSLLWTATLGVDHLSEPKSRRVPGISSSC